jgi:hypothetical protein
MAAVAGGAASGSPDRRSACEAATGVDGGRIVCLGSLPSSHARVVLKSRNGSSERGIALVTHGFHETKVVIRLTGAPSGVGQPARIRRGGCLGKTLVSLGNVVNGRRLAKVAPIPHVSGFAIVVHASTTDGAEIVACGVVPRHHRRR